MTGGGVSVCVRVRGITAIFLLEPFCVVVANLVLGEALDLIPVGTVVSLSAWAEEADRICNTRSDYIYIYITRLFLINHVQQFFIHLIVSLLLSCVSNTLRPTNW